MIPVDLKLVERLGYYARVRCDSRAVSSQQFAGDALDAWRDGYDQANRDINAALSEFQLPKVNQ